MQALRQPRTGGCGRDGGQNSGPSQPQAVTRVCLSSLIITPEDLDAWGAWLASVSAATHSLVPQYGGRVPVSAVLLLDPGPRLHRLAVTVLQA